MGLFHCPVGAPFYDDEACIDCRMCLAIRMIKEQPIFRILKAAVIFFFIISVALDSSCVCGRPPDFNVINPVVISDETGEQIIAFQRNSGKVQLPLFKG